MRKFKDVVKKDYWGNKYYRDYAIASIIRNILNIIAAITLYVTLHNTGLLIYIICMLQFRWKKEDKES